MKGIDSKDGYRSVQWRSFWATNLNPCREVLFRKSLMAPITPMMARRHVRQSWSKATTKASSEPFTWSSWTWTHPERDASGRRRATPPGEAPARRPIGQPASHVQDGLPTSRAARVRACVLCGLEHDETLQRCTRRACTAGRGPLSVAV